MKVKGFQKSLDERASDGHLSEQVPWRQLRYFLGRLQSYRQAADTIIAASFDMTNIFNKVKISYIKPAKSRHVNVPANKSIRDVAQLTYPDLDPEDYNEDVRELEKFRLNRFYREQLSEKKNKDNNV